MKELKLFLLFFITVVIGSILVIPSHIIEKTSAITSTNTIQKKDPGILKATLFVNNGTNSHDMTLYSCSTDKGNHLTGLDYPSNIQMSLPTGSYIKVRSGNPNFKLIATEVTLYKDGKNDNPLYPQPAKGGQWYVNTTPGVYHLRVNSDYTPSNDDVATFVNTVQIVGKSSAKDLNQPQGQISSGSSSSNDQTAKQLETKTGLFKIIIQINGVNKDKYDKMVFVTGNPSSALKFIQSRIINSDSSKVVENSSYSTTIELPKDAVKTGEKFLACLVTLQPLQVSISKEPIICKTGMNTPEGKPEIIIFNTKELISGNPIVN